MLLLFAPFRLTGAPRPTRATCYGRCSSTNIPASPLTDRPEAYIAPMATVAAANIPAAANEKLTSAKVRSSALTRPN